MTGREITKPKHLVTDLETLQPDYGKLLLNHLNEDLERQLVTRYDASYFLQFKAPP